MTERIVTLKTFDSELDAEIARKHLESHNIEARVIKDDAAGMYPMLQWVRGVKLVVRESDEVRAREVLDAMGIGG
jgi:hypothetical protein